MLDYLIDTFPWMFSREPHLRVPCPVNDCYRNRERSTLKLAPSVNIVTHLNDQHQMDRESIAQWLEETASELGESLELPVPEELDELR